jgi:hypothetical protein
MKLERKKESLTLQVCLLILLNIILLADFNISKKVHLFSPNIVYSIYVQREYVVNLGQLMYSIAIFMFRWIIQYFDFANVEVDDL